MGVETDRAIAWRAGQQEGIVTRVQLVGIGLSVREIEGLLRRGRLHRVHRGVYHVGHSALSARGVLRAALLAAGDNAVLSHRSAAAHWELISWTGYPELTTTDRTGRGVPNLIVHRVRNPPEATSHKGLRVTSVEQTILDLASILPAKPLGRALGEAEYKRIIDRDHLRELAIGRPGAMAVREALGDHDAPSRSTLEDDFLNLLRKAELPHPELNATVYGKQVDFLWRRQKVIVETDGWAAHGRRDAFDDDRARDLDLEARGYRTARITERQMKQRPLAALVRVAALVLTV